MSSENTENSENKKQKVSTGKRIINWIKNVLDFSKYNKTTKFFMIFFIAIIILMIGIYVYQFLIDETFLPSVVFYYVIIPLRNLGIWGAFIFFGLMVLQSIVAPIPSEMILFASGLIWQLIGGAIIGYIGSMISAMIGYYIAYRGGKPLAINTLGQNTVDSLEYYMSKYGFFLVLGMRMIPIVPYDLFTLASGFTQMKIKKYTIATGIGTAPRALFYSWLGIIIGGDIDILIATYYNDPAGFLALFENSSYTLNFNIILLIIVGTVVLGFLLFYIVIFPYMKKGYKKHMDNINQ
ncbi:MAG: TVP38/TMEM64 family protein [Candidatus Helarchaeota archaeon]